jgi:hypothetical protein
MCILYKNEMYYIVYSNIIHYTLQIGFKSMVVGLKV